MQPTTALILESILLISSFGLQTLPRINRPYYGIDTWRWLLYADAIRKNRGRLPSFVDKYLIQAPLNAPPALLVLLAKILNKKQAEKFNFLVNPFFNILENILLFFFVFLLTHNYEAALFASFIFSITPADLIENSDLNMRSIGKLSFQMAFVGLGLILSNDTWPYKVFFSLAVAFSFLSHRMSTQFLLLLVILITALTLKMSLLLYFLIGLFVAIIVSKGYYLKVAENHFSILKFWWQNQRWRFANVFTGKIAPTTLKSSVWVFVKRLVLRNPYLFICVPLLWNGIEYLLNPSLNLYLKTSILLALALAILTTFVPFLFFFGEGYRYIGLISFQVAVFLGVQVHTFQVKFGLINYFLFLPFLISITVILAWIRKILRNKNDGITFSITGKFQEMLKKLDQLNTPYHFMSIPCVADDAVAYFSPFAKVAFHDNGVALLKSNDYYPVIKNLSKTLKEHQIDYCLIHKNLFAENQVKKQLDALGNPYFHAEDFVLYKINL